MVALRTRYLEVLKKNHQEKQVRNIPQLEASLSEIWGVTKKRSPLDDGNEVIRKLQEKLNTFNRSELQKQMHEVMIKCCNKIIFGNETVVRWEALIRQKYKWKDMRQEQIITAPRRFGKTYAVAMFVVALALAKPGVEISIFYTGARASGQDTGMMGKVKEFMKGHFQIPDSAIVKDRDEHFFVKIGGVVSKIHAYPGSVDTYVTFISR